MKNKNGFTLIELLAVIVMIALIMTLAIPSVQRIMNSVKDKSYTTKIQMIEAAALSEYESSSDVLRGSSLKFNSGGWNGAYNPNNGTFTPESGLDGYPTAGYWQPTENLYPCLRITVDSLAENGSLNYDETNASDDQSAVCKNNGTMCTDYLDKVVLNPKNNNVINKCYVYIYYKNNRIYTVFDRDMCDSGSKYDYKNPYDKVKSYEDDENRTEESQFGTEYYPFDVRKNQ